MVMMIMVIVVVVVVTAKTVSSHFGVIVLNGEVGMVGLVTEIESEQNLRSLISVAVMFEMLAMIMAIANEIANVTVIVFANVDDLSAFHHSLAVVVAVAVAVAVGLAENVTIVVMREKQWSLDEERWEIFLLCWHWQWVWKENLLKQKYWPISCWSLVMSSPINELRVAHCPFFFFFFG